MPEIEQHMDNSSTEQEDDVVCYCGLRERCPAWHQMNDAERRLCSADKRMTAEYFWKHRLTGT